MDRFQCPVYMTTQTAMFLFIVFVFINLCRASLIQTGSFTADCAASSSQSDYTCTYSLLVANANIPNPLIRKATIIVYKPGSVNFTTTDFDIVPPYLTFITIRISKYKRVTKF